MKNIFANCTFLKSAHIVSQLPDDIGLEIAVAGRSNAGKSTTINALTGNKKMAKISKTPGRTQLLNCFDLGDNRRLVDLPGYGYAKVPVKIKQHWDREIEQYLQKRKSLIGVVVVMDIRHPLKDFDKQFLYWADQSGLFSHVLLNKADKFKSGKQKAILLQVKKELINISRTSTVQIFSGLKKEGIEQLSQTLYSWFNDPGVVHVEQQNEEQDGE
ncbi:MAG: ribosome biogenesis GTP-binding protein YihA/YsxC [Gammaproteobacteria bacterium]|jgi:GTP-binding protein|nr:YihA family ribosome biogenesis GTP-binding protein [Xanthomonadales bacterium]